MTHFKEMAKLQAQPGTTTTEITETLLDAVARQIAEQGNRIRGSYRTLNGTADHIFGSESSTDPVGPSDTAEPVNSLERISQSLSDLTKDIDHLQTQVERFNSL